jgi:hypothetical protein
VHHRDDYVCVPIDDENDSRHALAFAGADNPCKFIEALSGHHQRTTTASHKGAVIGVSNYRIDQA